MTVPEHGIHYLEIVTPDVEAACRLYGETYGWTFEDAGPALGNAFVAQLPGGSLCGIRAPMHAEEQPVVRPYLRVEGIEEPLRKAEELGAEIALGATELPGHGIIAI
jgi:predicted enzyme related to lactoylglutathione lyase